MSLVAGLILAGGTGRRMGGLDKPLLLLSGKTLLDHVAGRLFPQASCIALSANGDPSRFAAFGLPVLPDPAPDLGPLGGVMSGLEWAFLQGCDALLTVPGDTPFIPPDLAYRLQPAPAVAVSDGRVHHAVALWPVSCRAALRVHLQGEGSRSIARFARTLAVRDVAFECKPADPFFNINTPEDLRAAEGVAGSMSDRLPSSEPGQCAG